MSAAPYTAIDVAGFCGVTLDALYRSRYRRHLRDKLPRPYSSHPLLWHRDQVDAWRAGHTLPQPANDVVPHIPQSDDQHRAYLAQHYGAR